MLNSHKHSTLTPDKNMKLKNRIAETSMFQTWYLRRRHRDRIVNFDSDLDPESFNKARKRWLESRPDTHLTWGKEVTGHAFIRKVLQYAEINSKTSILEIGPGYGRLLKAIFELNLGEYYGVDISSKNIERLKREFSSRDSNIHFIEGDIETIKIDRIFDLAISSLTLKHFYPSFEKGLRNISLHLKKGGVTVFDLIEGNFAFHEEDGTFIRLYSKSQVRELVESCNLEMVAFDKVTHIEGYTRLVTVARK
ncbi:MAG: class I SAM-dependent methyltransferase [Nitrososphaeraceae archaeon]